MKRRASVPRQPAKAGSGAFGRSPEEFDAVTDRQRLAHELEVHQIELKTQNEELQAARFELEAGLARYTALFDFAPVGYATVDINGVIRELNHAGARLLGSERRRLFGRVFQSFLKREHYCAFNALMARAREGDTGESVEVLVTAQDGPARRLCLTATSLAHPEPVVLLAFEDITERKDREEKLARTEAALREADRRKDEFLAVLSHELRNPLAPIQSSLFTLARVPPGGEQSRRALVVIERQVTQLTRLIDDLLDVTRITRNKIQLRRERLELGALVRRILEDHRASFESDMIQLEGRFEPGDFWIDADPVRITQAVTNLLGNAQKFTPGGGTVVVGLQRRADKQVALSIHDTGPGIPKDLLPHLFEPFTQGQQTLDRSRGGLGLGLTTAKGLVESHDGTVHVQSGAAGVGTEIVVVLPLSIEERPTAAEEQSVSAHRPRRVLVIEDNRDAANALGEALAFSGHDVQVAYDGPEGLAAARRHEPEVVVCDLGLPGMDGYAVARSLRADPVQGGAFLVALSGYGQPEDIERASKAGFDEHVVKPADVDELDALVAAAPIGGRANSEVSTSSIVHKGRAARTRAHSR